MSSNYVQTLCQAFAAHADPATAEGQKAYMKHKFEFYGLKSPLRKELQKPFLQKAALPPQTQLPEIIKSFWETPARETQYFAQELLLKYARSFSEKELALMEYMVTTKSWWDTVDYIASNCIGCYFKKHPDQIRPVTGRWMDSGNMWLQRSALLFQLKYKDQLDTELLEELINPLLGSKEFFINKAIGWALRQHSKTDPVWVQDFADRTPLAPLSRKEALRLIR